MFEIVLFFFLTPFLVRDGVRFRFEVFYLIYISLAIVAIILFMLKKIFHSFIHHSFMNLYTLTKKLVRLLLVLLVVLR